MNKFFLLGLITVALLLSSIGRVSAQEPTETPTPTVTPTVTPTPGYLQAVPMSTENEFLLQKTVTYGDMAIVISVLILATVQLLGLMVRIPRQWMSR